MVLLVLSRQRFGWMAAVLATLAFAANAQVPPSGGGDERTDSEARSHFTRLADSGNAAAQTYLCQWYGDITRSERLFPYDPTTALRWCRAAALQGRTETFVALSLMYEVGDVMPMNNLHAYMWAFLADRGGNPMESTIRRLRTILSPVQVKRAEDLAGLCRSSNFRQCQLP
jgi:TPR repeat protein